MQNKYKKDVALSLRVDTETAELLEKIATATRQTKTAATISAIHLYAQSITGAETNATETPPDNATQINAHKPTETPAEARSASAPDIIPTPTTTPTEAARAATEPPTAATRFTPEQVQMIEDIASKAATRAARKVWQEVRAQARAQARVQGIRATAKRLSQAAGTTPDKIGKP